MTADLKTGQSVRAAARSKALTRQTSGLAPNYLQANLIVLPSRYADDFRKLCWRNPVPCPLLAESVRPGAFDALKSHVRVEGHDDQPALDIVNDIDLRNDAPKYRIYKEGQLVGADFNPKETETADIVNEWTDDHVGFLIGCSYSFEGALEKAGLPPRHVTKGRNVPMYRTNIPLAPSGVFTGSTWVVSMRPYRTEDVEKVRDITRPFVTTHGEPVAWGWEAVEKLGIKDISAPEWGDGPFADGEGRKEWDNEGLVPVFWGCGVTPQEAVMRVKIPGTVMAHAPGHMIVLDVKDQEVFPGAA
ncbi:hypothetical protein QBC46DRAFT_390780 [Diplogelasinospora grovesii]|uniref:Hydro-lyase n=1 Tax=Diplogelasinospora grovesii TaxID=303347 RepID=A0AAN6N4N9_9PEZI|nr:hypothetical protein QBC46DRAFT_390780 [Diplogelasinospora grovesii]